MKYFMLLLLFTAGWQIQAEDIKLPEPDKSGGKPLMQALNERASNREFSRRSLKPQQLSDLLWATAGLNRPEAGKRTAPSGHNVQDISIYVLMRSGSYLYDEKTHTLVQISAEDQREKSGGQDYVKTAAVNLAFVSDHRKMKAKYPKLEERKIMSAIHAGMHAQNSALFAASADLAAVTRGWFDPELLKKTLKLDAEQFVVLTQSIGVKAKK